MEGGDTLRQTFSGESPLSAMLESLFTGKFGGVLIMVLITAFVVFMLRALFGPRGMFRDPKWDESNRRIRQKEAEKRERILKEWQETGRQDGTDER